MRAKIVILRAWFPVNGLPRLENFFKTIIDTMRDGIVVINRSGQIKVFNRAAEEIFGYSHKEVVGQIVDILIADEAQEECDNHFRRADFRASNNNYRGRDLTGQGKDGSSVFLNITVSETELSGEVVYVAVCRDVSVRKQAETDLQEKISTLELLYMTAENANRAATGLEAMASSVRDVCVQTGWPVGHIFLHDEIQPDQINSICIWYLADAKKFRSFQQATEDSDYGWAEGLPGRVLASAKLEWATDVQNYPSWLEAYRTGDPLKRVS